MLNCLLEDRVVVVAFPFCGALLLVFLLVRLVEFCELFGPRMLVICTSGVTTVFSGWAGFVGVGEKVVEIGRGEEVNSVVFEQKNKYFIKILELL